MPVLLLDDDTVISESVAICRYFEGLRKEPPLFGRGAQEEALVEMWNRRLELNLLGSVSAVFRHLHPAMREMDAQVPESGEANRPRVLDFLGLLDSRRRDHLFVAGAHYTIADITGMVAIDFMKPARLTVPLELTHLRRWHAQVAARPSASA